MSASIHAAAQARPHCGSSPRRLQLQLQLHHSREPQVRIAQQPLTAGHLRGPQQPPQRYTVGGRPRSAGKVLAAFEGACKVPPPLTCQYTFVHKLGQWDSLLWVLVSSSLEAIFTSPATWSLSSLLRLVSPTGLVQALPRGKLFIKSNDLRLIACGAACDVCPASFPRASRDDLLNKRAVMQRAVHTTVSAILDARPQAACLTLDLCVVPACVPQWGNSKHSHQAVHEKRSRHRAPARGRSCSWQRGAPE